MGWALFGFPTVGVAGIARGIAFDAVAGEGVTVFCCGSAPFLMVVLVN